VLGAAETVAGLTDRFRTVADKPGFYAPNPRPPLRLPPAANRARALIAVGAR